MTLITDTWRQLVAAPSVADRPAAAGRAGRGAGAARLEPGARAGAGDDDRSDASTDDPLAASKPIVAQATSFDDSSRHVLGAPKDPFKPAVLPKPTPERRRRPGTTTTKHLARQRDRGQHGLEQRRWLRPTTARRLRRLGLDPEHPVQRPRAAADTTTPPPSSAPPSKPKAYELYSLTVRFGDASADLTKQHLKRLAPLPDDREPRGDLPGPRPGQALRGVPGRLERDAAGRRHLQAVRGRLPDRHPARGRHRVLRRQGRHDGHRVEDLRARPPRASSASPRPRRARPRRPARRARRAPARCASTSTAAGRCAGPTTAAPARSPSSTSASGRPPSRAPASRSRRSWPCSSPGCSSTSAEARARRASRMPAVPLRIVTAGESHGPGLTTIVEGIPAGLELDRAAIDRDLARRQLGHGRGGRMKIESDAAQVTAGVRHGRTLGGPIALQVANRDYANWEERMNPWPVEAAVPGGAPAAPRPRGPRRDDEVRLRRRAQRARARQRPRDGGARGRRRGREGVPARARRRDPLARHADRLGHGAAAGRPRARRLRRRRRVAGPLPRRRGVEGDGRGDQRAAQAQRVARRHVRAARLRRRARPRLARLLGGAHGRAARPRDALDPGGQGRRPRRRLRPRGPARLGGPRRDLLLRPSAATTARPTARAASRAA